MRTHLILGLFGLIITISNSFGQTAAIDSFEKDYMRGDFGLVIRKVKNELKSDTTIKNRVFYYHRLASVYHFDQHLDSALYFINKAIELDENVGYAFATRSYILYSQRKYKEALNDITKAIQFSPESVHYIYLRASLYKSLKKKKLAKMDLEKVMELAKKENNQGLYSSAEKFSRRLVSSRNLNRHTEHAGR